jgi:hypothetical protein
MGIHPRPQIVFDDLDLYHEWPDSACASTNQGPEKSGLGAVSGIKFVGRAKLK